MEFEAVPSNVRAARTFVAGVLDAARVASAPALLLTSELASNVVQHARTRFEVHVEASSNRIRVELHDGRAIDDAFRELIENHPGLPPAAAADGRGLLLLSTTTAACGLIEKDNGKAVWFEVEPDQPN